MHVQRANQALKADKVGAVGKVGEHGRRTRWEGSPVQGIAGSSGCRAWLSVWAAPSR